VGAARRTLAAVFAGDRRVWRAAAICAVPLVVLLAVYCVVPREYFTGTDSVEALTYVAETPAGAPMCVPDLELPAGTAGVRMQLISRTAVRPALQMVVHVAGRAIDSGVPAQTVSQSRISAVVFRLPTLPAHPSQQPASLCVRAGDLVNWGGTPLPTSPPDAPTRAGAPIQGRIALWYLPAAGARRSYLAQAGAILRRASLFRPGIVGPWLYVVLLLVVLPGLALAAVRCLALAAARSGPDRPPAGSNDVHGSPGQPPTGARVGSDRRLACWLFAIAAVNFVCWALITPAFQAPDEVDHFAYTQSLVERGQAPSRSPASPLARWSSAENVALEDSSFFTDHQLGDTRAPWTTGQQQRYRAQIAAQHPPAGDGGGNETAATHGPIYYAALAPAYALAGSSPFTQLTSMRVASALIGALTVLFTFLLVRELAPGRPWLAVLAALLVAFQPMYGFISGAVNNDVGVNAGAAGLELLLLRMLRRGITLRLGLLTGVVLIALPIVKSTAYSLYPVAAVVFVAALWRHHRRADAAGWAGLAVGALVTRELSTHLSGTWQPTSSGGPAAAGSAVESASSELLAHPLGYLSYLWQVFLPRLPFMAPHFETGGNPAFTIFVKRGWGAFGWYVVLFDAWVYKLLFAAMLLVAVLAVIAAGREWRFVRAHLLEIGFLLLVPIAVVAGFEAAFYTTGVRTFIPEFGRYAFPAIAPLAALVVGSLHALGRRWALLAGAGLLTGMIALSAAAQLLTLTSFYA